MVEVMRRGNSVVEVRTKREPVDAYLEDARALMSTARKGGVPEGSRRPRRARLLPRRARSRRASRWCAAAAWPRASATPTSKRCSRASRTLNKLMSLVLFDDAERAGDVGERHDPQQVEGRRRRRLQELPGRRARRLRGRPRTPRVAHRHVHRQHPEDEMTVAEQLQWARYLLDHAEATTAGVWPRASALLARHALEQLLEGFLGGSSPSLASANKRAQLIALRGYPPVADSVAVVRGLRRAVPRLPPPSLRAAADPVRAGWPDRGRRGIRRRRRESRYHGCAGQSRCGCACEAVTHQRRLPRARSAPVDHESCP